MSAVPAHDDDDGIARLRVPPHSREGEQSALGALLLDNSAWGIASDLLAEGDFYSYEHRLIYAAIGELIRADKQADVITVFERLQALGKADDCGGLVYLNALAQSVSSARNVRQYAQIVRDRATMRRLIAAADEIATAAYSPQARTVTDVLRQSTEALAYVATRAEAEAPEFPILGMGDLDKMPEQDWLVHNVIPCNAVGCFFGGSGSYKSFLMLDLALHVVYGMQWLGQDTKQGPVVIIVAEGATGTKKRVKAWRRVHSRECAEAPLHVIPVAVDILADAKRVAQAVKASGIRPVLVIIDTLSQTFSGEENSANEVAAYLRACGHAFRVPWECSVAVVHHTGHQFERPRGSSAIKNNTDFLFGVFRDKDEPIACVFNDKQKEEQDGEEFSFRCDRIDLGQDAKGHQVTSLVAHHIKTAEELREAVAHAADSGRKGYHAKLIDLAKEGQKEKDLRAAFYEACEHLGSADSKSKAFRRAVQWATNAGILGIINGEVRVFGRL